MKVPFIDLRASHHPIRAELDAAIGDVVSGSAFAGGIYVERFEQAFANYCNVGHAIGVGSGTEALWLALKALGIGLGDQVITSPCSFIATAEAISQTGATPVFVDIQEDTFNLDASKLEASITPKTKAIIPVHLFGQMSDMISIGEIAGRHGLSVVEDAAQAHGAKFNGSEAGSLGTAGCFSFYPSKNLGALGEAGAVVTNDAIMADRLRQFRDHGQTEKYHHSLIGWNARMDGIQGAVLDLKLKHLDGANSNRRKHAERYNRLLGSNDDIRIPYCEPSAEHVYHIYSIQIENRDRIKDTLKSMGIECGIHYPVPLHLQEAYRPLNYQRGDFPVAEKCSERFLSLPMYPELTEQQIRYVCESLYSCLAEKVGIGG